jgi:glycosyltransferase involved in cell wall biosynthesis
MAEDQHPDRSGRSVLYLTYDGLCDPIGQSQVLPYLIGCARAGHAITIISFEKPHRLEILGESVAALCKRENLHWVPQSFRSNPPYLAKLLDLRSMNRAAAALVRRGRFDFVHARSYVAGVVALGLKRRFGIPLLFDMRGFWPDQRREGRRWRAGNVVGDLLYRRWKRHERDLIRGSDHLVVLTQAARDEVRTWPAYRGTPISIIPCCADFDLFRPAPTKAARDARASLGISPGAPVLGYLGSIGTVYLLDQLLLLFDAVRKRSPDARLLFIGQDDLGDIRREGGRLGLSIADEEIIAIRSERAKVPYWLGAIDVGTCFITPTFSSKGVSATKLAEYLACGIPVIANAGIGDTGAIIDQVQGGYVLPNFSPEAVNDAAHAFQSLMKADGLEIRLRARQILDLPIALRAYRKVYDDLCAPVEASTQ